MLWNRGHLELKKDRKLARFGPRSIEPNACSICSKFHFNEFFHFSITFLTELKEKLQSEQAKKESQKGVFEKLHGWLSNLG